MNIIMKLCDDDDNDDDILLHQKEYIFSVLTKMNKLINKFLY
jgi:hypothetical protein